MLLILTVALFAIDLNYGQPVYPLYAIDSGHDSSNLTQNDIDIIAKNFDFIQASYSTPQLDALHKANRDFSPVWYINSDTCPASTVEHTDRYGASYFLVGNLTQSISATDTKLGVKVESGTAYLKASTTSGNYSVNIKEYVTFIRMGDELMKIVEATKVDNNNQQTLTVIRAFNNSKPSTYNKNANIFHPVYNGGGYPGGTRSAISYTIDPKQMFGKNRLVAHTMQAIQNGYNGSWFDCFSSGQFNAVDQCGNKLHATWSFELGQYYNKSTFHNANQERLTYVLNQTNKELGYYPVIVANNVAGNYFANAGNGKMFLQQDKNVNYRTNLNGYSLESFAGREIINDSYQDGCPIEGVGLELVWQPYNIWLRNVEEVMDASQNNLGLMPMVAQAGCKSIALEVVPSDERDAFEQYAYASFLLGVESMKGNSRLGIPAFYQNENKTLRFAYVHPRYYWKIGNPIQTEKYENITNYRLTGKNSFVRYFENGLIIVNPTNITDYNVPLNKTYYNPNTQQYVKTIDSAGQRGYILLNNESIR